MIRFRCPSCDKTLKAPETLAGKAVTCPRCHEQAQVPSAPSESPVESLPDETRPGFFAAMSPRLRWAVAGVAVLGGLGLLATLLPVVLKGYDWLVHGGMVVAGLALVALLTILYGHASGCPRCGGWWSRTQVKSEVADREVTYREGAAYGKSATRTDFRCTACRHTWSVTDSEEYRVPERTPTQQVRKSSPGLG